MALVAKEIGLDGLHEPLLMPTSMIAEAGQITVVEGEIGPGSTTFALALAGRVKLSRGEVAWNRDTDPALRRRKVAVVNLPDVTEPDGGLHVRTVIGHELALAGQPSRRRDIARFLTERGAADLVKSRWEQAPHGSRTGWLAELAFMEDGVEAIVVTHPDRWGGDVEEWAVPLGELIAEDRVIVIVCTPSTARILGLEDTYHIGVSL
ncbi:hypothetical protein SAMN05421595_2400 [Austwickia chelonae]|uniref:ABC transporter ATP-binding protein n=1 Tax=Austwickia chelonae NBRC 105200 TaxID=1184607 RepID=K6WA83_9MICO|nr:hypothetical protein [Austwickia chelonae]GAB78747.1 hypothetical protein AUCHE_16_01700 [Austwickia chelonae NBRC 105200]SEW35215.1 hypothetical protein SAMN05421595_2400 [Austwickia chelonae]